jgi:lipoprotein-anchoring transpeptidase ErfK/SrfK
VRRSPVKPAAAVLSLAVLLVGAACGSGPAPLSAPDAKSTAAAKHALAFPRAGVMLRPEIVVRAAPSRGARSIGVLRQFRPDSRPTIVFAIDSARDTNGRRWYRIELPGRSNKRLGWIAAAAARLSLVHTRIVVDVGARSLKLYVDGRLRYRTKVAVGRPTMETPTGSFYIRAAYHATETALGAYAFETSAYSKLSDWPGGGIIGIHGTPQPQLLGKAVSHGCVRVSNLAASTLERLVPVGTAVTIVR